MPLDKPWGPIAHGKAILLGEHSVVYGHNALAGAIDRGVRCRGNKSSVSRLRIPRWQIDVTATDAHPVAEAFAAIVNAAGSPPVDIEVDADLPAGAGLGSSAALCVAVARCIAPNGDIPALASFGEARFHDTPSGIDIALSYNGGLGSYRRGTGLTPLVCRPLPVVIALSGIPRSTAKMVSGVYQRKQHDRNTQIAIEAIASLTEEGIDALVAADYASLGVLMNRCHEQLQVIGVSLPTLDNMVGIARDAGAFGAKLTGAGGGGCIIALAPEAPEQVALALQGRGYESFITELGSLSSDRKQSE